MGVAASALWGWLWPGDREYKLLLVGLDNAGKTTTLYQLQLGEVVRTQPTVGSNVETVRHRNLTFEVWDLGGQAAMRPSWATYFKATDAVFLVVDSTDRGRLQLARAEAERLLRSDDLRGAVLLVLANKQDLADAMGPAELCDALGLHAIKSHDWHIQACSAKTGAGLNEGMGWVAARVGKQKPPPPGTGPAGTAGGGGGGGGGLRPPRAPAQWDRPGVRSSGSEYHV